MRKPHRPLVAALVAPIGWVSGGYSGRWAGSRIWYALPQSDPSTNGTFMGMGWDATSLEQLWCHLAQLVVDQKRQPSNRPAITVADVDQVLRALAN